jgi:hypothetical protein
MQNRRLGGESDTWHISTTLNISAHVLPEMHRDAMDKMDDFFGEEEEG